MLEFIRKIKPIIKKEFRQIKRDGRTLFLLIIFPALLLVIFGYAANFDVKNISIVVVDEDKTIESRNLSDEFMYTEYFDLKNIISERKLIDGYLSSGYAKAVIIIPSKYSEKLKGNDVINLSVIIDGSDSNTGGTIVNYINLIFQNHSEKLRIDYSKRIGKDLIQPVELRSIVWFNPDLKTVRFLLPGLIAFILMIVATVSTTLSIVREKEKGNMEQLIVSPISAFEIVIGKSVPYLVFSIIAATLVIIFGIVIFGVTVKGNILLLYFIIILFIIGALGMGLLISALSETTQVAFMVATFSTLLPTFLLSGFIFPIKNMPIFLQIFSYIVPAKYFIIALRSIVVKGVGIAAFWEQVIFLIAFAILTFGLSTLLFIKGRTK